MSMLHPFTGDSRGMAVVGKTPESSRQGWEGEEGERSCRIIHKTPQHSITPVSLSVVNTTSEL